MHLKLTLIFTIKNILSYDNPTLFYQIIPKLDHSKINKLVKEIDCKKNCKGYHSWTHLLSILFYQFTKNDSIRYISSTLRSATQNLNNSGINKEI